MQLLWLWRSWATSAGWKIGQSPNQALQFAFNGLSVGAVYALLAMGFTLVYSTVWFFDLYYGASAALGVCPRIRSWRRKPPRNNLLTVIWTLSWSN